MRHIVNAIEQRKLPASIGAIIVNNSESSIFDWAKDKGLNVTHISNKTHPQHTVEDGAILDTLQSTNTDYIVLSGYMKKLGAKTLSHYDGHILNVHPALLPRFGGKGMYGDHVHAAVLGAGDSVSGATIHLVTANYDEGPILKQQQVPVHADDTIDSLRQRIQAIEPVLYLETLQNLIETKREKGTALF